MSVCVHRRFGTCNDCVYYIQVPLGIELKSEQKVEEMVAILDSLQKYVPKIPRREKIYVPGCVEPVEVGKNGFFKIGFGMYIVNTI